MSTAAGEARSLKLDTRTLKVCQVLVDVSLTRLRPPMRESIAVIARVAKLEPIAVELVWRCLRRDNPGAFEEHERRADACKDLWRDWESLMHDLEACYASYCRHLDAVLDAASKPHSPGKGEFRVYAKPADAVRAERLVSHVPRTLEEVRGYEEGPLLLCDRNSTIRYVNEAWSSLTGYVPDECVGRTIGSLIQGTDTDTTTAALLTKAVVTCDLGCAAATLTNYEKDGTTPFRNRVYVSRLHGCGDLFVGLSVPLVSSV